jgi:hypothetical protein
LEAEIGLEISCDFTDETLEGELPDEELGRFLENDEFHGERRFQGGNDEAS